MRLFQKQTEHEKREMVFEVLAPLAENGRTDRPAVCLSVSVFPEVSRLGPA